MQSFNLNNLLRPHILTLTPYSPARDEYTGTGGVFLDASHSPDGSMRRRQTFSYQLVIEANGQPRLS